MEKKRTSFTGSIGFVLAAAGSAVGLGNIWRFPYLAAKDGGGLFLFVYIILALTFGFALLTTEVAIGRKTKQSPLTAYGYIHKKWRSLGLFAYLIPSIILPYYATIGGWVVKYMVSFITGAGVTTAQDGFFTGYITSDIQPIIFMIIFLGLTSAIILGGVQEGIEKSSRILMPILVVLILVISIYSLTLEHTDANGVTRTGLQGFAMYVIPNFDGLTFKKLMSVIMDAMGQLFFSLSVAMGIMIAYGSYVKDEDNLSKSINQIEIFDTAIAFLAGMMIIPSVFTFTGTEGMSAGPGLMFVSMPKIFEAMGGIGRFVGIAFFVMVLFAALTSCVSIMEAIVSSLVDRFKWGRTKSTLVVTGVSFVLALVVCFGYNIWYFDYTLPNGSVGQILDIFDYISNSILMPFVAIMTCVLIGWVVGPKTIIDEVEKSGHKFGRKKLYIVMIKFVAPVMLFVLLLQAFGIF